VKKNVFEKRPLFRTDGTGGRGGLELNWNEWEEENWFSNHIKKLR
jgi:hypothetical protein